MQNLAGGEALPQAPSGAGTGVGWQYVLDLHGCTTRHLDDVDWVRETMLQAAAHAGASVVGEQFHRFVPQGISGVVVIGESHLAIHIWPERAYAAVDLFTCCSRLRVEAAAGWLAETFGAAQAKIVSIERGLERIEPSEPQLRENSDPPPVLPVAENGPRDDIYIGWDEPRGGHWFINERTIVSRQTQYQRAEIMDFARFGRVLVLDGNLQSTERDEYIYHEALVQPAMCLHHLPRRVLILGGGEGATAREIFKHETVDDVVMVDIDGDLVSLAGEHLESWHRGSLVDPRLRLVARDGYDFIRSSNDVFDVIIVDLLDSFEGGLSEPLYSEAFFADLKRHLAKDGILTMQAMECDAEKWEDHARLRGYLKGEFHKVHSYAAFVPSFCATWGFIFASDFMDPRMPSTCLIDSVIEQRGLSARLRFYDGRTHEGLFALPKDMRSLLGES
ncbi:MAG TPA: adenosylmethionine decarboxylase [Rhizomicrobium sp.]|nr:adenosylmethionine decarboxylase [Rhizomicrobium sp.]